MYQKKENIHYVSTTCFILPVIHFHFLICTCISRLKQIIINIKLLQNVTELEFKPKLLYYLITRTVFLLIGFRKLLAYS